MFPRPPIESRGSKAARRHRVLPSLCCALAGILLGLAAIPFVLHAQVAPVLTSVEPTQDGYALVGKGFGRDPAAIRVFEGRSEVFPTAVVSVSDARIVIRSRVKGAVQHSVAVAGLASNVMAFTHGQSPAPAGPGIASLTISPAGVEGGASATVTLQLTAPAPANVVVALALTGAPGMSVPPQAVIPAGKAATSFSLTTPVVTTSVSGQVTATLGASSRTASFVVSPPVTLSSFAVSPVVVESGTTATATVTLAAPAPAGGATVSLSSSAAVATVPPSVTVPADSTSAQFSVQVGSTVMATAVLTATAGSSAPKTVQLIVNPAPLKVASLTLNPAAVQGGHASLGSITLTAPAPAGGATITLTSSHPEATVPATALVMPGGSSGSFNIATRNPSADVLATISAKLGATEARTATLTITSATAGIGSLSLSRATVGPGAASILTIDLSAAAPPEGATVSLASSSPDATVPATVAVAGGGSRATIEILTSAASAGGVTVKLTATLGASHKTTTLTIEAPPQEPLRVDQFSVTPASVDAGKDAVATVTLNREAPAGGATVHLASDHPRAPVLPQIAVAAGSRTAQFSIHTTGDVVSTQAEVSSRTVTATLAAHVTGSSSRTTTLVVRPVVYATSVASIAVNPVAVQGGNTATVTVTLQQGAPEAGLSLSLASSHAAAVVPSTVTIPAGWTSGQVTIQTSSVTQPVDATITATLGTVSRAAVLAIHLPLRVTGFTLTPSTVLPGGSPEATVTLNLPAPAGGVTVALTSSGSEAVVPPSVVVAAGATTARFTVQAGSPSGSATATLSAAVGTTPAVTAQLSIVQTLSSGATMAVAGQQKVQYASPPSISASATGARMYVLSGLGLKVEKLTPGRELRIKSLSTSGGNGSFVRRDGGPTLPIDVSSNPDGIATVGIPVTFVPSGYRADGGEPAHLRAALAQPRPPTSDKEITVIIGYEWRESGGTWQPESVNRPVVVGGHEQVSVSDTWVLKDWLRPFADIGLGACLDGIQQHGGDLAFQVTATPGGADCAYEVMTTQNRNRVTDWNSNLLPEGVVLAGMTWRVETGGTGCCLGYSMNQACAPLPTAPAAFQFYPMAVMDSTSGDPNDYAVFTDRDTIMTYDQIIIGSGNGRRWRTAFMSIYGRLSCSAVNPVTQTTQISDILCDAGCSELSGMGLAALVPSGTGISGGGRLEYIDQWRGECRIAGGPLNGQCRAVTGCPPGHEKFADNGVWKCRATSVTSTPMPWIRVRLESMTVLRPPGTQLPW